MMLVPDESKSYHFRNFAIIGSSNGPRNSIVVPGALAVTLTSKIQESPGKYLTYRAKAQNAQNEPEILNVRLYESKKGQGAPGVKAEKPWLSVVLSKDSLKEPDPLTALNKAVESLGFTGVSSTQAKTTNGAQRDLATVKFSELHDVRGTYGRKYLRLACSLYLWGGHTVPHGY